MGRTREARAARGDPSRSAPAHRGVADVRGVGGAARDARARAVGLDAPLCCACRGGVPCRCPPYARRAPAPRRATASPCCGDRRHRGHRLLAVPFASALSSVVVPGVPILPSADLYRLTATESRARVRSQDDMLVQKLTAFLKSHQQGEQYLIATSSARLAAPIIVETGDAVMARGGFHGLDPILTPEHLQCLSPTSRRLGGDAAGQPIADWNPRARPTGR